MWITSHPFHSALFQEKSQWWIHQLDQTAVHVIASQPCRQFFKSSRPCENWCSFKQVQWQSRMCRPVTNIKLRVAQLVAGMLDRMVIRGSFQTQTVLWCCDLPVREWSRKLKFCVGTQENLDCFLLSWHISQSQIFTGFLEMQLLLFRSLPVTWILSCSLLRLNWKENECDQIYNESWVDRSIRHNHVQFVFTVHWFRGAKCYFTCVQLISSLILGVRKIELEGSWKLPNSSSFKPLLALW